MDCGLSVAPPKDMLKEIKESGQSDYVKIREYKKYLLDDQNLRFPDIFLEFIARERLELPFSEEEIREMREHSQQKQEEIEIQDAMPNKLESID